MKRTIDIVISLIGLIIFSPILVPIVILVWLYDFHSPFYLAKRVGKDGKLFKMVKIRSMIVNADSTGINSTASDDKRITPIGKIVRRFKLDEISQLWNVLKGDMSLVGPRPQVPADVALYTKEEQKLLSVKPGITDMASIVFADEAEILEGSENPDLRYNQLIRPWKSRLGLLYVKKHNLIMDIKLIFLTAVLIFSREKALKGVYNILKKINTDENLKEISLREKELIPFPPPGSDKIVDTLSIQ